MKDACCVKGRARSWWTTPPAGSFISGRVSGCDYRGGLSMPVEVTVRHMNASQEVQDYARAKAEAMLAEFPKAEHAHVILDIEKHRQIAELVVQAKGIARAEAKEESDNLRASIDMAFGKVEKQLRRFREKVVDHRPRRQGGRDT
ncbi:MAG: HPF/RaiA family ribosome-associated protein [Lentisphaerae bacterium]|nr:HPF/RaiA family ribosome-associated protein [Lentisphaerota bacterium]